MNSKLDELLVTFFYLGKLPKMPGTFGSLGGLLILFSPEFDLWMYSLIVSFLLILISYNSVKRYEKIHGNDNSKIVIDEVVGMMIIFSNPYMEISEIWVLVSFVLFRIFDILKPFPINKINEKIGSHFVFLDDIASALFTMIFIQLLQVFSRIVPFWINFL